MNVEAAKVSMMVCRKNGSLRSESIVAGIDDERARGSSY